MPPLVAIFRHCLRRCAEFFRRRIIFRCCLRCHFRLAFLALTRLFCRRHCYARLFLLAIASSRRHACLRQLAGLPLRAFFLPSVRRWSPPLATSFSFFSGIFLSAAACRLPRLPRRRHAIRLAAAAAAARPAVTQQPPPPSLLHFPLNYQYGGRAFSPPRPKHLLPARRRRRR